MSRISKIKQEISIMENKMSGKKKTLDAMPKGNVMLIKV